MYFILFYFYFLEKTPTANGTAGNNHIGKSGLIPNGMPSTVVPCTPEKPLANGIPNGHAVPVQDSPFIGYIIAMHRKMVSIHLYWLLDWKSKSTSKMKKK